MAIISSFSTAFLLKTNDKAFAAKPPPSGVISNIETIWNIVPTLDSNGLNQAAVANCPNGKIALGGGGFGDGYLAQSSPTGIDISSGSSGSSSTGGTGWQLSFGNLSDPLGSFSTVYVICGKVNP